jgi:hypothetical protein
MKHAKRMILVPEDAFARFEQKLKLETSPLLNNMMQKETEMSDILQRKDIEDDEKQKLYYANLERYMNIMQQKSKEIPTVQLATNNDESDKTEITPQETSKLSDSVIVENVPRTMRPQAIAILNRLKTRSDVISWDENGQVRLNNVDIPHSNISDMISDAVRKRKHCTER